MPLCAFCYSQVQFPSLSYRWSGVLSVLLRSVVFSDLPHFSRRPFLRGSLPFSSHSMLPKPSARTRPRSLRRLEASRSLSQFHRWTPSDSWNGVMGKLFVRVPDSNRFSEERRDTGAPATTSPETRDPLTAREKRGFRQKTRQSDNELPYYPIASLSEEPPRKLTKQLPIRSALLEFSHEQ